MKLDLSIEINDHGMHERLSQYPDLQITVFESVYFGLEKSWKSTVKRDMKNFGNPDLF